MVNAQSYNEALLGWREIYTQSLLIGSHPLKPEEAKYLRFFAPDEEYNVKGDFVPAKSKPFLLENKNGGKRKAVSLYGTVTFELMGATLKLNIYRFVNLENVPLGNDKLFIPFTDRSNDHETFAGGRYLDLSTKDIKYGKVVLDFNKCYNPHTAYEKYYPYMVPPKANHLPIDINAGEKKFGFQPEYYR